MPAGQVTAGRLDSAGPACWRLDHVLLQTQVKAILSRSGFVESTQG